MSSSKKNTAIKSIVAAVLFVFTALAWNTTLTAQQEVPFRYPDPRTVGVQPYIMQGEQPGPVTGNRYAGVTEQERQARIWQEQHLGIEHEQKPCPLCEEDYKTPCGTCKMCVAGFPCEKTLCRHCILPRSKNMGNSCDLAAGDEPCGTCDSCREHRSDPCEHADNGFGPRGEYNPHHEPRLLSVIPTPLLDFHNNGARKFPVYYNSAPTYRPNWNPSLYVAYARPFTFRYSCELCAEQPCKCATPGLAGQVPYAYTCKFCNRSPCACAQDICDVNKPMDPKGISQALAAEKGETQAEEVGKTTQPTVTPGTNTLPGTAGGGISVESLLDETTSALPSVPGVPRPSLDTSTLETLPSS